MPWLKVAMLHLHYTCLGTRAHNIRPTPWNPVHFARYAEPDQGCVKKGVFGTARLGRDASPYPFPRKGGVVGRIVPDEPLS